MESLLYFNEDGRLYIAHECELCERYPLEDINEECLECGVSQAQLLDLKNKVDKQNEAYDFFKVYNNDEKDVIQVKGGMFEVSSINIGKGYDSITLVDSEETGNIRKMSELVDKFCYVIFYCDTEQEDEYNIIFEFGEDD